MLTFLGTEKYLVMILMLGIALVGLAFILTRSFGSFWTKRDIILIGVLTAILTAGGILVVFHPAWPVTPLHLLLR